MVVGVDALISQAMSFNTGLSFEIYDLAGLGDGNVNHDGAGAVANVVDVLAQALEEAQAHAEAEAHIANDLEEEEEEEEADDRGGEGDGAQGGGADELAA